MIKYTETLQNERGDVLPGYRLQVVDSLGAVVAIYSDKGGTRFTDASGNIVNYATADEAGWAEFYWTPAEGQILQTLDLAGDLARRPDTDFADKFLLDLLPGNLPQASVDGLTTALAERPTSTLLASTSLGEGSALVGYKRTESGTTARTIQAKLDECPSVLDFGATGDGSTDDTAAFDAAATFINATKHRTIFVPAGEYILDDWTPPVGCKIIGEGNSYYESNGATKFASVLRRKTGAAAAIDLAGTDTVLFQHLDIDGNGGRAAASGDCVRDSVGGATQIRFFDCHLYDGDTNIKGSGASTIGGLRVYDCVISDSNTGISEFRDTAIGFSTFTRNRTDGIRANGGQIRIFSNFFEFHHNNQAAANAIAVTQNATEVAIIGNVFDRNAGYDVKITSGTSGGKAVIPNIVQIVGNVMKGAAWGTDVGASGNRVSIFVVDKCKNLTVTGNAFERRGHFPSNITGVRSPLAAAKLNNATDVVWIGNNTADVNPVIDFTTNTTIDAQIWEWTASASGTAEYYLTHLDNTDGDPWLVQPDFLTHNGANLTAGTVGSLAAGEYAYADNDSLGHSTLYVRLTGDVNPNTAPENIRGGYSLPVVDYNSVTHYRTEYARDEKRVAVSATSTSSFTFATNEVLGTTFDRKYFQLQIAGDQAGTGLDSFFIVSFGLNRSGSGGAVTVREGTIDTKESGFTAAWASGAAGEDLEITITADCLGEVITVSLENTSANRLDLIAKLV